MRKEIRDALPLCKECDGTGIIKGTVDFGGMLPDLECYKCFGTGKDYSKYKETVNKI